MLGPLCISVWVIQSCYAQYPTKAWWPSVEFPAYPTKAWWPSIGTPTERTTTTTKHPTPSPTPAPTYIPTVVPSSNPSLSPTEIPTLSSSDPTYDPTHAPSLSPSTAPTTSPSTHPTDAPTFVPTIAPSASPTRTPTLAPSAAPSNHPSFTPSTAPSFSPTNVPSNAPSSAPTRIPTAKDAYSRSEEMIFMIRNLSDSNKLFLDNEGEEKYIAEITSIIEESYVFGAKEYVEKQQELQYKDFEIMVNENRIRYNRYRNDYALQLISSIHYAEDYVQEAILFVSDKPSFLEEMKQRLMDYFGATNEFLAFSAVEMPDEIAKEAIDWVMYGLLVFMVVMVFGSLAALVFNKKETKVDNAQWRVFMIFGLQIVDLVSDLNLNIEILSEMGNPNKIGNEIYLYIAGIGGLLFMIISYVTNIAIAGNIKKIVSDNSAAVAFFEQRAGLFILLVVFSGSAYPVLALLSSRIFALDLFNCGLTLYEMRQLSKLKIFGSVLLENVPQCIFQVFYTFYSGSPSKNTYLSFASSFLSIVTAVLTHFIDSKSSECYVTRYDLQLSRKGGCKLSKDQQAKISGKKECKSALRTLIASAIKIEQSYLELGHVTVTAHGFVIRVIHYVFKNELDAFKTEDGGESDENEDQMYQRLTKQFTFKLYSVHNAEVKEAFIKHFVFDDGTVFRVKYFENYGYKDMLYKSKRMVLEAKETVHVPKKYANVKELGQKIMMLFLQKNSNEDILCELMNDGYKEPLIRTFLYIYTMERKSEDRNAVEEEPQVIYDEDGDESTSAEIVYDDDDGDDEVP
eukprot:187521_1